MFTIDSIQKLAAETPAVAITAGVGNVTVEQWAPRHLVLCVDALTPVRVQVHQFSGWDARAQGNETTLQLESSRETGLITFLAHPGKYRLDVSTGPKPEQSF